MDAEFWLMVEKSTLGSHFSSRDSFEHLQKVVKDFDVL
jgi:hypothetical protein